MTLSAYIFAILTATVKAGEFLQPWTAGKVKDYSHNINYAVGVNIQAEWDADFTNATIILAQDNKPGDARGGPTSNIEQYFNGTTLQWAVSYEGMDPALNNVFYFVVTNDIGTESFNGHYFNISDAPTMTSSATAAPSTAGSPSLFTVTSTAPASSGLMTPQPTSPATITVAPSKDDGTPVSTIAGMVVGILVGSLLLVGGAWWAWKVKKRWNPASRGALPAPFFTPDPPYFHGEGERKPSEADGIELYESAGVPIHELRASVGRPMPELYGSVGQPRHSSESG